MPTVKTKQLLKSGLIHKGEKDVDPEQLFKAGLIQEEKGKLFQADLAPVLKEIEKSRELPLEERDYLYMYLILENFIINNKLGYTAETLRASIKNRFNIQWFTPRLKALFNLKEPDSLIFFELILEAVLKHLSQNYLDLTKKVVDEITKNQLLKGIIITEEKIDLDIVENRVFANERQFGRAIKEINELLTVLHEYFIRNIGASQTKKFFKDAFDEVKTKYSNIPQFTSVVRVLPKGILEEEKFSLLSKEELERISRRLARVDLMKSEFTNIAAHELKTPLVPILGFLERLLSNPKKFKLIKETQKQLEICLGNAKRLDSLIEDITLISKLESGELRFHMEELDLKEVINDVYDNLLFLTKKKNLKLELKLPSKLLVVNGDEKRITQVLTNLVDNAIKFTKKGSITISAKQEENQVVVQVKDTGIGIDKKNIPNLFTKYYRADRVETRETKGTGLGLAICKEIVEKHGGKIWVNGELGKGSVFNFSLPI